MTTATQPTFDLNGLFTRARTASRGLARADRNAALEAIAQTLVDHTAEIVAANQEDVEAERAKGTSQALLDRLSLSPERITGVAEGVRQVIALPDPLQQVLAEWTMTNGVRVRKVSVPFGVIGMIYESRPNVTVDAAVLALKAGSSAVLRGSANALRSNRVLVRAMQEALAACGLDKNAVQLIDSADRNLVTELLSARGKVDLVIPRGGASLINHVVDTAKVPVIETGTGNCHIFVDEGADLEQATKIVLNAKTQRPGVCNAAETLLVHKGVAQDFLPRTLQQLKDAGVRLHGDARTQELFAGVETASEADWETEYLDLELAVKVVDSVDEAIDHINRYGTMHSEAILTGDAEHARHFQEDVDAAAVYTNASTRFTDGFEMGFGAEIGISTQKLHARGPMGLMEMTTYKYLLDGEGQVRA